MQANVMRGRYVAAAILLELLLGIAASIILPAPYGYDPAAIARPGSIVDRGQPAADLLRWGALLDMASYLPVAVLVVYLHYRLRKLGGELFAVLTAGGLAYVLIGSVAGALLASAGPPLIEGYASATDSGREAARVTLEALGHATLVGLWGTLELIPFGIWFIGIGWVLRRQWPNFAALSGVVGVVMLVSSARTGLTGRTLVEIDSPVAMVIAASLGLFFVWQLWLAVRLWRGDAPLPD